MEPEYYDVGDAGAARDQHLAIALAALRDSREDFLVLVRLASGDWATFAVVDDARLASASAYVSETLTHAARHP